MQRYVKRHDVIYFSFRFTKKIKQKQNKNKNNKERKKKEKTKQTNGGEKRGEACPSSSIFHLLSTVMSGLR